MFTDGFWGGTNDTITTVTGTSVEGEFDLLPN